MTKPGVFYWLNEVAGKDIDVIITVVGSDRTITGKVVEVNGATKSAVLKQVIVRTHLPDTYAYTLISLDHIVSIMLPAEVSI